MNSWKSTFNLRLRDLLREFTFEKTLNDGHQKHQKHQNQNQDQNQNQNQDQKLKPGPKPRPKPGPKPKPRPELGPKTEPKPKPRPKPGPEEVSDGLDQTSMLLDINYRWIYVSYNNIDSLSTGPVQFNETQLSNRLIAAITDGIIN